MRTKPPHTQAWMTFSHAALALALAATGFGLWMAPLDIWIRGFLAMGVVLSLFSAVNVTKSKRDMDDFRDQQDATQRPWLPADVPGNPL
jgi:hypothetical protein